MSHRINRVNRLFPNKQGLIACLTVLVVLFGVQTASSRPRKVTWDDLRELKNGKEPKHSVKTMGSGMLSSSMIKLEVSTPRAQAAQWAGAAKDNYIKLDSSTYNPALFNQFVKIYAYNLVAEVGGLGPEYLTQIERGILVIDGEVYEADSTQFIRKDLQNVGGAKFVNVDAVFYFPLNLFDGLNDIKIVIIHGQGKEERKLKKKDIRKLE